ncbi:MAG: Sir2 family NAD-dependent protein deacetylase, partial [Candidatus Heimdallarchaeota archaeon]
MIINSKHLVIFTGAGISTASGLSDYRGPDGVWTRRDKGLKPLSIRIPWNKIQPNDVHYRIVDLFKLGLVKAVLSQNVDGLHLDSGLETEILAEIHGNKNLMKCKSCDSRFTKSEIHWNEDEFGKGYRSSSPVAGQPSCTVCGGQIISSIINFGDPMPEKETEFSLTHSKIS